MCPQRRLGADGPRPHRRGRPVREHLASAAPVPVLRHRLPTPLPSSRYCATCRRSAPPQCGWQRPPRARLRRQGGPGRWAHARVRPAGGAVRWERAGCRAAGESAAYSCVLLYGRDRRVLGGKGVTPYQGPKRLQQPDGRNGEWVQARRHNPLSIAVRVIAPVRCPGTTPGVCPGDTCGIPGVCPTDTCGIRCSTRPHTQPETPSPRVNQSRGSPI
jgi:hypothetical protein